MANQLTYENLTVSSSAVTFTAGTLSPADTKFKSALIRVETGRVRYRGDGTAPTASVGVPLDPGDVFQLVGEKNVLAAQFIRRDSTDATVHAATFDSVDIAGLMSSTLRDSGGRGIVVGPAAEDAAVTGSPVLAGGRYDSSDRSLDNGDVGAVALNLKGHVIVAGPSASAPVAAMTGASEVQHKTFLTATNSSTRATLIDPSSGKKVRMISLIVSTLSTTGEFIELYWGTQANLATNPANGIFYQLLDLDTEQNVAAFWPDGAGPVGSVDEVLSIRTQTDLTNDIRGSVVFREE